LVHDAHACFGSSGPTPNGKVRRAREHEGIADDRVQLVVTVAATTTASERTAADSPRSSTVRRRARLLEAATLVQGVALAVMVSASGSASGRVVRVVVVIAVTVGALSAERAGRPRIRAAVALLLGVAGTTIGLAIGVSFLARSGLSLRGLAATVVLVTGLALLGAGTVGLVRAAAGWRRWLAVPVGFVVLQFVMMPMVGALLVTNPPPTAVASETPADRGFPYDDVVVPVADGSGVMLSGWYIPSRNGAAIVMLHGSGSTRSGVLDQAVVLARHGYGVLLLDARGHGNSTGSAMDVGWFGAADTSAAVDHLRQRAEVDPGRIGVLGESMGGEEAVTSAARDHRIRAAVGEGVQFRLPDDHDLDAAGPSGAIERITTWEQYALIDLLTDAPRPEPLHDAVIAAAPTPILLIAGRGEVQQARSYRDASPGTVDLWELPDTAHTAALATHPDEWENRVTTFFDRTLGGSN